jgi:hypothetical protein
MGVQRIFEFELATFKYSSSWCVNTYFKERVNKARNTCRAYVTEDEACVSSRTCDVMRCSGNSRTYSMFCC